MDHARALRALGDALRNEGENATDRPENSELLCLMGDAHHAAADQLMGEIAAEATATAAGHRCTIDHRAMPGRICTACGATKG
jgi:protein involved in temperature-dependent protein secretion